MKKIVLLAGLLLSGFLQAQEPVIEVTGNNGELITDGYVYTSHELGESGEAKLNISVTNLTDETIYIKLKMNSMVNATGNGAVIGNETNPGVQFCFQGSCYFQIDENEVTPSQTAMAAITAGSHNNVNDHFSNSYPGDVPGQDVIYNMSFVQYNANGTEIGPLVNFTYKYAPTMGTNDFASLQNMGLTLNSTVVKNQLAVNAAQKAKMELYSVTGQLVKTATITEGNQSIDVSGLSAAVYIAKFINNSNQASSIRIVKN